MNNYPNDPTTRAGNPYAGQTPPPPGYSQPGYPPQSQPGYPPSGPMQPYPQQGYPPQGYPQMPPQTPMQPPKKKSKKGLWITLGCIIGAVVICGAIASTSKSNTGTKVDTTTNTSSSSSNSTNSSNSTDSQPTQQHFKVGDTVKVDDNWKVVVNGIKTSPGGQFDSPKPGHAYAEVDVSITNTSAAEETTSSIVDWTLLDSTGAKGDWSVVSDGSTSPPDGKIEAGQTLRGTLAYEVDATQKKFTLEFAPSMFSSGQTLWDLSVS